MGYPDTNFRNFKVQGPKKVPPSPLDLNQIEDDDSLESLEKIVQFTENDGMSQNEQARDFSDRRDDLIDTSHVAPPSDRLPNEETFNETAPIVPNYANISRIPRTTIYKSRDAGKKVKINKLIMIKIIMKIFIYCKRKICLFNLLF